jgi:hypothetical protein
MPKKGKTETWINGKFLNLKKNLFPFFKRFFFRRKKRIKKGKLLNFSYFIEKLS